MKCKSITRSQPGEISEAPKSVAAPPGSFQNRRSEYPSAAVGTMKGMSARVSRTFSHLDFPREISHARGSPVIMSNNETRMAIMKEF